MDPVLELCRKVSEQIDAGLALEYIAGEFLAIYQASAENVDVPDADAETSAEPLSGYVTNAEPAAEAEPDARREKTLCPDDRESLPVVEAKPYTTTHREVLDRDGYRCQYPGCSVRAGLQVHHVVHRSRFGGKSETAMNDPSNLVTVCWFHHRVLHAELIGLTGTAPESLAWRRPAVMETATERHNALAPIPEVPNVWQPEADESHYETTPAASG